MNSLEFFLDNRRRPAPVRDDSEVIDWLSLGLAPEQRIIRFDAWARALLAREIDWAWAGPHREKRIEQCRIHLERLVLDLWRRGWFLDGKRLATHITRAVRAVAEYQRKGVIANFWAYYQTSIDRYVGLNAEEIRDEATRAGTHIAQALRACRHEQAPTMPELLAQRKGEVAEAKQSLREKISKARKPKGPEPTLFEI